MTAACRIFFWLHFARALSLAYAEKSSLVSRTAVPYSGGFVIVTSGFIELQSSLKNERANTPSFPGRTWRVTSYILSPAVFSSCVHSWANAGSDNTTTAEASVVRHFIVITPLLLRV